ncbi:carboxypeptidase B-like [Leguminivora glycinivorella]|uniref:carboxypeptidase B-like n=1 Tax=Leguminivora glycinivorella TaxID=1035111 RepID=UPI00200F6A28|nr:carboxypeptidase B-like [Leguminivora glycinivorella]
MVRLFCFLAFLAVAYGRHELYEGHQLFKISGPAPEIQILDGKLDLLSTRVQVEGRLQALVRLSPEVRASWLQYFEEREISYNMVVENLAEAFRQEDAQVQAAKAAAAAKRTDRTIGWDTYYRHQEINNHLDELASRYSNVLTVVNGGQSYEGRQIKVVRISTTGFQDTTKPVIIIDAMVHSREWVTTPVALYIINQLVVDTVDRQLIEDIDWVIIPVANPDGYEYTHETDRLWRKTRSRNHTGSDQCPGIDGNRNFDHYWGTVAANAEPCSIIYEGPEAFSESEIRLIRDVVQENIGRAAMYISLHSYGNMFLYAWGNNGSVPDNGDDLQHMGDTMATAIDALALNKSTPYVVGNAAQVLYFTTGTSRDWTRAAGVPITYTLELPGYEYNFEVPPTYVDQVVKETWAGIVAGAHLVRSAGFSVFVRLEVMIIALGLVLWNSRI